jgi:hypothetical protein
MTHDEIMALSPEELRIKIAEILQKPYQLNQWDWKFTCPDWPNNIAAAWGLVKYAENKGYWVEIRTPFLGDGYWCGITPDGVSGWNGTPDNWIRGEKIELAIARAFYLWYEATK